MILYLAEKPSLGRAIAAALPPPHRNGEGCIHVSDGAIVSWAIGHLLEQVAPEVYDERFKQWQLEHLPILPETWQLSPKATTRKQFTILKKLIHQADQIVHCGDPDREGQLLIDEIIRHVGVSDRVQSSIQRCLISDLNLPAVRQSLNNLRPNREFAPLSISALARSRADWLYGINMTRAYTIQGKRVGYQGLVSVGRVQTPLLGLVVRRDGEIAAFCSAPFYEVVAHVQTPNQGQFVAKWQPSDACLPHMDSEGRVLNKALAENVVSRINDVPAVVSKVESKAKKQAPPLPYSLSVLQIDAAKRYGHSAQTVLDTCQSLYEQHKAITYPRSDNRFLPLAHFKMASGVLAAILHNTELHQECGQADLSLQSQAWNDAKVGAHHGIIPTNKHLRPGALTKTEQQIYELICRQYLSQFYPPWAYVDRLIEVLIAGGRFLAKLRSTQALGWKSLLSKQPSEPAEQKTLPEVTLNQILHCNHGELVEKETQPPAPYTDATLLAAMTGISRYVSDPDVRKILKETDGLGTEATRAGIIELLFKRQFLKREGKQIRATDVGKGLIQSLPESMTLPDMTAEWESVLNKISLRERNYADFMAPLTASLVDLTDYARKHLPDGLKGLTSAAPLKMKKKKNPRHRKSSAKSRNSQ